MANKIEVDLVADLKLALNQLGLGKDIEKALKSHKSLVEGVARSIGLDLGKALAAGFDAGAADISRKIKDKVSRVQGLLGTPLNLRDFIDKSLGPRQSFSHGYSDHSAAMRNKVAAISAMGGAPHDIQSFINQSIGPRQAASHGDAAFWEKALGPVPPVIAKGIFARIEQSLGGGKGGGGLLGGFGRYEVGNAFMHSVGLGGGVGGRLGGAAFSAVGGKVPGATVALAAFAVAIDVAKHAIEGLIQAAREGAKLYEQSRALGISTIQASSFIKTLGSVGIDEGSALRLAAYGEFGRGGRAGGGVRGNVAGEMISSGMRGGMSALEIQQIRNMSQEINQAWAQTREAAIESAQVARANFSIQMELAVLKIKLQTTLQELSSLLEPIIYGLSRTIGALLDEINKDLAWWIEQLQKLHIIPSETSNPSRLTPFTRDTHITSLEKMGLVIGGHQDAVKNYLKDISKNTGDIVKAIAAKTTFTSSVVLPHGADSTRLTPAQHATYQAMTHGGYTPPAASSPHTVASVFDRFVRAMQQGAIQDHRNELYGAPAAINMP